MKRFYRPAPLLQAEHRRMRYARGPEAAASAIAWRISLENMHERVSVRFPHFPKYTEYVKSVKLNAEL